MKEKALVFVGLVVAQLAIANCVALGMSLHELYGEIADSADRRRKLKKAKKELEQYKKQAKQTA